MAAFLAVARSEDPNSFLPVEIYSISENSQHLKCPIVFHRGAFVAAFLFLLSVTGMQDFRARRLKANLSVNFLLLEAYIVVVHDFVANQIGFGLEEVGGDHVLAT